MKGLLLTLSAVGTTAGRSYKGGVDGLCSVYGTWGGATVTIEFSPDAGTTWITCLDSATSAKHSFTENSNGRIDIPEGLVRMKVTGGSPGTLNAVLYGRR